jgi:hypothetical protein
MISSQSRSGSDFSLVTDAAEIPYDDEHERICVGLAAVGRNSAADLLTRLDLVDCRYPGHRRILEHAVDAEILKAEDAAPATDRYDVRLAELAKASQVDVSYLRDRADFDAAYAGAEG